METFIRKMENTFCHAVWVYLFSCIWHMGHMVCLNERRNSVIMSPRWRTETKVLDNLLKERDWRVSQRANVKRTSAAATRVRKSTSDMISESLFPVCVWSKKLIPIDALVSRQTDNEFKFFENVNTFILTPALNWPVGLFRSNDK